jgi:hypothetical protein
MCILPLNIHLDGCPQNGEVTQDPAAVIEMIDINSWGSQPYSCKTKTSSLFVVEGLKQTNQIVGFGRNRRMIGL